MATRTTAVIISDALLHQVEHLAQRLDISQNQVFQMALEEFIAQYQDDPSSATPIMDEQRIIHQGDIYWVGSRAELPHPYVVIQDNVLNHSRIWCAPSPQICTAPPCPEMCGWNPTKATYPDPVWSKFQRYPL